MAAGIGPEGHGAGAYPELGSAEEDPVTVPLRKRSSCD